MNKIDQLVNALRIRYFRESKKDNNYTDSLALGYLQGLLGVLEKSDDKLVAALDYHLQDTLEYNAKNQLD